MQALLALEDVANVKKALADGVSCSYKWSRFYEEEVENLIKSEIRKGIKNEYAIGKLTPFASKVKDVVEQTTIARKKYIADKHNNNYVFITINPPPTVTLAQLQGVVQSYVTRNIITRHCYVYEQRSTDPKCVKGIHCHILCERNVDYKPSKFTSNTQNTFKRIIKDPKNSNHLNIQFVGSEFARDKQSYILDVKKGEADGVKKSDKQLVDVVFRKNEKLEDFYGDKIFE